MEANNQETGTVTVVIGGREITFRKKAKSDSRGPSKAQMYKAIKARCRDCAETSTEIRYCDGEFIGYSCALHPYRPEVRHKRQDENGKLCDEYRKSYLWAAIRKECRFCCNNQPPRTVCSSPSCSLYPYRGGPGGYRAEVENLGSGEHTIRE